MAINRPADRNEAYRAVSDTLAAVSQVISKAFGPTIPKGFFDPLANELMRRWYGKKKAGARNRK